jgi:DNA topoisomerase-1
LPSGARHLRALALTRGDSTELVVRRRRCGAGFIYLHEGGRRIRDSSTLERIRALAIPPNYRDVRIAADPRAHLQAIGCDDAGRTQYRYHPNWEAVRERQKIDRLSLISHAIGRVRRRLARDLRRPPGNKEKALAALVMLLDRSCIRIGGESYVQSGRSRGAATLLKRNVAIDKDEIRLRFFGKGGKEFDCSVRAPALAAAIQELMRLPGRRLFQYRDADGRMRAVTAADANAYLNDIAGAPVTAKDFRTLAANAAAATRLAALKPAPEPAARRRQLAGVIREVSELLGNTPAVARKSYVHRELVNAFEDRRLSGVHARATPRDGRRRGEDLVAALFGPPAA